MRIEQPLDLGRVLVLEGGGQSLADIGRQGRSKRLQRLEQAVDVAGERLALNRHAAEVLGLGQWDKQEQGEQRGEGGFSKVVHGESPWGGTSYDPYHTALAVPAKEKCSGGTGF